MADEKEQAEQPLRMGTRPGEPPLDVKKEIAKAVEDCSLPPPAFTSESDKAAMDRALEARKKRQQPITNRPSISTPR